ncbi:MAG: hypothetical protein ACYTHN_10075 [Planctomycetota bacterium]|jgi:hypothetical protein
MRRVSWHRGSWVLVIVMLAVVGCNRSGPNVPDPTGEDEAFVRKTLQGEWDIHLFPYKSETPMTLQVSLYDYTKTPRRLKFCSTLVDTREGLVFVAIKEEKVSKIVESLLEVNVLSEEPALKQDLERFREKVQKRGRDVRRELIFGNRTETGSGTISGAVPDLSRERMGWSWLVVKKPMQLTRGKPVVLGTCWAAKEGWDSHWVNACEREGKIHVDTDPPNGFHFIGVFTLEEAPKRK